MKLIDGTVKLNKEIIASTFLSHDAILAYTGLCIAMIQLDKDYCLDISVEDIAHYLGFKKIKWYTLHRISKGLEELRYNTVVDLPILLGKDYKKKYITSLSKYYLYEGIYSYEEESYIDIRISEYRLQWHRE